MSSDSMHHGNPSKIPNLTTIEAKYGNTFKRAVRECYENNNEKIHDYAYKYSDSEEKNPNHGNLTYSDYSGPGEVARVVGGEALANIDNILPKIREELEDFNNDPERLEIEFYLGKCALKNGDE